MSSWEKGEKEKRMTHTVEFVHKGDEGVKTLVYSCITKVEKRNKNE